MMVKNINKKKYINNQIYIKNKIYYQKIKLKNDEKK